MSAFPAIFRRSFSKRGAVANAILLTAAITIACKVLGFVRELAVAAIYGASPALDAYLVAMAFPQLLFTAISSAIGVALLPRLLAIRNSAGPAAVRDAQRRALFWTVILLLSSGILFALAGPWLLPVLSPGFDSAEQRLTRLLLWAMIPFCVISGVSQVLGYLANGEGRFAATAAGPGLISVVSCLVLLAVGDQSLAWPLVVGLTLGAFAELVFTCRALRSTGYDIRPLPGRFGDFERSLWRSVWPISVGALLQSATLMVDQSMASLLGPGTVSELNYGNRLVATVMGVIALTVSRVAFPAFSRMAAEERFSELRGSLKRFATLTVFLSAPAVIVLSYGSEFVVNATFRRGQFTWETAERVSLIQSMFALQIPFYLVGGLFARAASALEMNRMVLAVGSGAIVANILLNGALIGPLGAPGLALATTIVYVGTCLGMGMVLRSRLGALEARQRGKSSETLRAAA